MTKILVPVIQGEAENRKANLFELSVRERNIARYEKPYILLNNEHHSTFTDVFISYFSNLCHCIDFDCVTSDEDFDEFNECTYSVRLGIYLVLERYINKRKFKEDWDAIVVTGNIGKSSKALTEIDEVEKKYESLLSMENSNKSLFIYVSDKDVELKTKNNITVKRFTTTDTLNEVNSFIFDVDIRYYADYVERWGIPEGIFELNVNEIETRYAHYTFYKEDNKLIRVSHDNMKGIPIPHMEFEHEERPTILDFVYEDKIPQKAILRNEKNQIIFIHEFRKYGLIVNYLNVEDGPAFISNYETSYKKVQSDDWMEQTSIIKGESRYYNDEGQLTKVLFNKYHNMTVKSKDSNGIFGYEFVYDNMGRIIERWNLNLNEERDINFHGIAATVYEYDEFSNIIRCLKYIDLNNNLINNVNKVASYEIETNKNLDKFKIKYYDKVGNPTYNSNTFNKGKYIVFTDSSILIHYLDNDYVSKDGIEYEYEITEKGEYIISIKNYEIIDGELVKCKGSEGYYEQEDCFKPSDNTLIRTYFDENYDLVLSLVNNASIIIFNLDEKNRIETISYYDEEGEPTINSQGYHCLHNEYDDENNEAWNYFSGIDGNLLIPNHCDYAAILLSFDENHNIIRQCVFDSNWKPYNCNEGYAMFESVYEDFQQIKNIYYKYNNGYYVDNNTNGVAVEEIIRNEDDFKCKIIYKDSNGKRTLTHNENISSIEYRYNRFGKLIEKHYFDCNDKPKCPVKGVGSKFIMIYDYLGRVTQVEQYYKKKFYKKTFSTQFFEYDDFHRIIKYKFFMKNKALVVNLFYNDLGLLDYEEIYYNNELDDTAFGYATCKRKYNNHMKCIEESYFDKNNLLTNGYYGYAVIKVNSDGLNTITSFYDKFGNKIEYNPKKSDLILGKDIRNQGDYILKIGTELNR